MYHDMQKKIKVSLHQLRS